MTAEQRYDFFYERDIQFYSSDHYAWYEEFESGDIFLHHRFATPGQPPPHQQDGRDELGRGH
jgi:hypothetical protein